MIAKLDGYYTLYIIRLALFTNISIRLVVMI